jgi:hypothetical protein
MVREFLGFVALDPVPVVSPEDPDVSEVEC